MPAAAGRPQAGSNDRDHLLPASNRNISAIHLPHHSKSALAKLSGGTVIWKIWPAVLLHTVFAAVIVVLTEKTKVKLAIPNVMLTILGVVIGFVISLRVSSGYDRYWWGRCAWSDIVKNSRTLSRLIWIHIPLKINKTTDANGITPRDEIAQAMREKKIALELIEGFAVAAKHYIRGELGLYYEDLYPVVRPFHEHHANAQIHATEAHLLPATQNGKSPNSPAAPASQAGGSNQPATSSHSSALVPPSEEFVPVHPVTGYGSVNRTLRPTPSLASLASLASSHTEHDPLLPSLLPKPASKIPTEFVPFMAAMSAIGRAINPYYWYCAWRAHWREGFEGNDQAGGVNIRWGEEGRPWSRKRRRAARQTYQGAGKHRPRVAGEGENLPLEIIRCISEWLSVLEARGVVSGNTLGGMYGCIVAYEDILSTLEKILTTPLPYVYSQHISTVWLYLFFLPFQLVHDFNWYTIPGTAVAAFFYLGFIAAGDEIEQPFGYEANDLDLDLFCDDIIKADLHMLTSTPFPNAPVSSHGASDINLAGTVAEVSLGKHHDHK